MSVVDIDSLYDRLGGKWHGRYFSTHCVFHDDDRPSLLVFPDGFNCRACGKSGALRTLAIKIRGSLTHRGTIPHKSNSIGWPEISHEAATDEAHDLLMQSPMLLAYMEDRRLADRVVPNRIGYWQGFYTVPIYEAGRWRGVVLRVDPAVQRWADSKYMISPGSPALFSPDWLAVLRAPRVYCVFGICDALALAVLRLPVITPTSGQTANPAIFNNIRSIITVVPDEGEEYVARRLVVALGWRGRLNCLTYPRRTKDPADYIRAGLSKQLERELAF